MYPRLRIDQQLPIRATTPGRARRMVGRALGSGGAAGLRDDVQLVVSELVTNAVRYGAAPMRLRVQPRDGVIEVEVFDCGRVFDPEVVMAPDESGRGLHIVAAIATSWGVRTETDGGKTVWALLLI